MNNILLEIIKKYLIKDLVYIVIQYLAFSGYKEIISTDVQHHLDFCYNLVLSPNKRLAAYASKNIVKLFDIYSKTLLKTIVTFHRIDGINFVDNTSLVYVSTDGIVIKHNLQDDIIDMTMILKSDVDNKEISLILLDADDTLSNELDRTGYYAIIMPNNSENIILSDMYDNIVINNKKYEVQNYNCSTTEGITIDKNNNLLVLKVEEHSGAGWNNRVVHYSNIQIIDINNFNNIQTFGINSFINYITVLKNNDIVTVDWNHIIVWRNYKILYVLVGHKGNTTTIEELESNDKDIFLVSASSDRTLKFWKNDILVKTIDVDTPIIKILVLLSSNQILNLLCLTDDSKLFIYS